MQAATIAGTSWLMLTALIQFILYEVAAFVLGLVFAVILFIFPIVNHIRIFIAIRRHNNQVHAAVSGQNLSAIFAREKKVAIDMFIVIAVLLLFMVPALIVNIFEGLLGDYFDFWYAWTISLVYMNSSVNPLIYLVRHTEIRNAVRSRIFPNR